MRNNYNQVDQNDQVVLLNFYCNYLHKGWVRNRFTHKLISKIVNKDKYIVIVPNKKY